MLVSTCEVWMKGASSLFRQPSTRVASRAFWFTRSSFHHTLASNHHHRHRSLQASIVNRYPCFLGASSTLLSGSTVAGGNTVASRFSTPPGIPHVSVVPFSSRLPRGGGNNRLMASAGAIGTGALVLFGKTKYILGALKLTKLASLGSMLFTIGTYSMFFGAPYAIGMVGLITIHECGHALVMMQRGIPFSPMVFMPFIGATVAMNRMPRDAWEDALVAFGGPVLGSLGAAGVAVAGHSLDSQLCYALADFGFMINLFNLLPIGSMDGGRIAGALSPYAGVGGLGIGAWLAWTGVVSNPIFYLILLAGGWESYQRWSNPNHLPPNYYKITPLQRAAIAGGYFGLIGGLLLATQLNNRRRKHPEVLEREKHWDMRY